MSVFNSAVVTSIDAITVVFIDVDQIVYVFSSDVAAITGAVSDIIDDGDGLGLFSTVMLQLQLMPLLLCLLTLIRLCMFLAVLLKL